MGMTRANRISNSIKNKFADTNKGKQSITVGEYIERNEFRKNRTWRLLDGKWYVDCEGVWLLERDFNKLYPKVTIPNFQHDRTNCDKTRLWLYE